jgi:hypothetical protein
LLPRSTRERLLPLLLVGALLLCHGVFGALHLVCYPPQCAGHTEHAAGHHAGVMGGAHEHSADHGTSTGYFAVLVGLLGLLLGLLSKGTQSRINLSAYWPVVFRRVTAVVRPPPTPSLLTLQVFRL